MLEDKLSLVRESIAGLMIIQKDVEMVFLIINRV